MLDLDSVCNVAINEANKSTMIHKHGAVIINKSGDILGKGHNYIQSYYSHLYSMHAEIAAIQNYNKKNKNRKEELIMLVVRVTGKEGKHTRNSKPCENCTKEIKKMGIKRTFYSDG